MYVKAFKRLLICTLFILIGSQLASAYDNDTHFWMTYYVARKAGYTHIQSMQIASADISVDFDSDSRPVTPRPRTLGEVLNYGDLMQYIHSDIHSLPLKEVVEQGVDPFEPWNPLPVTTNLQQRWTDICNGRKTVYWRKVWTDNENPGTFLHYLQDSYAHRYFMSMIGHAGFDGVDFVSTDPIKAKEMARMTLRYLLAYKSRASFKTGDAIPDPETIDLDLAVGSETLAEVDRLVDAFDAVNHLAERTENEIVRTWERLDPKRKKQKIALWSLRKALQNQYNNNRRPNSFLARAEVIRILNLSDKEIPDIWEYDLDSEGDHKKSETRKYHSYKDPRPKVDPNAPFIGYEARNFIEKRYPNNSLECLPFKLVPDQVTDIRLCKNEATKSVDGGIKVTFLGTTTLLIDDGETQLLTDGFFSRPNEFEAKFSDLSTNKKVVDEILARFQMNRVKGIFVSHSHYDHALDSAYVAERTSAVLYGSKSTLNIGTGGGLAKEQMSLFEPWKEIQIGKFSVTVFVSAHATPSKFVRDDRGGEISQPLIQPEKRKKYVEGGSFDFLIRHGAHTIYIKPSANYINGGLDAVRADVLFLGVARLTRQKGNFKAKYYDATVGKLNPKLVLPLHWDNFFSPLSEKLEKMPRIFDNTSANLDYITKRTGENRISFKILQGGESIVLFAQTDL